MPDKGTMIRAFAGAALIGVGLALMLSATRRLDALHEIDPETTAQEVAEAGAALAPDEIVVDDD